MVVHDDAWVHRGDGRQDPLPERSGSRRRGSGLTGARSLDARPGDALDEVALEHAEHQQHRDHRDERHREQRTVVAAELLHEELQTHREGVRVGVGQHDERPHELVPPPHEREDHKRGDEGPRQRQHDRPERAAGARRRRRAPPR